MPQLGLCSCVTKVTFQANNWPDICTLNNSYDTLTSKNRLCTRDSINYGWYVFSNCMAV